ncbi:MAG: S-methyl-5-thioribose-1-phosphate isomerase [Acidimicrobiales bacterium]|nr:S-methyl-5-thioribose-1-phosphate isomerase [Acidimicrobiales bacterium]
MDLRPPRPTVDWVDDRLRIIDQTRLPAEVVELDLDTAADVVDAISRLAVRGAPALGGAGALGVVVGFDEVAPDSTGAAAHRLEELRTLIGDARPTAVNLRWAVDRVVDLAIETAPSGVAAMRDALLIEALSVVEEDQRACAAIGDVGAEVLADASRILTHCNAGRYATCGWGTALAPVYAKHEAGQQVMVLACETRPLLQGARITAFELAELGVPVTVLPDGAAATALHRGMVDAVIVGADRIAANGDVANKIGTFSHALAARAAGVPFYVAAPVSTVDLATASGADIVIEERDDAEVRRCGDRQLVPDDAHVWNPAFDVTPAELVTGIITDAGLVSPPFDSGLAQLR